jgi:hypothetical protein
MVSGWVSGLLRGLGLPRRAAQSEEEAGEAGEAGKGDDEPVSWVPVLAVFNMAQAALAIARLHDEGIPAQLRHEAASTAIPVSVGILGMADVMVPEPMAEKAILILDIEEEDEDEPETGSDK